MFGITLRFTLFVVLASCCLGCGSIELGPWGGGPPFTLDCDKIGTGQQAITPYSRE